MVTLQVRIMSTVRRRVCRSTRCYTTADVLEELKERGFVHNVTNPKALRTVLHSKPQVIYTGVDPTAQSLHIGHLIPLMTLLHFRLRGHQIVPLIGGATGRVGDPSGRRVERKPAVMAVIQENVDRLTQSINSFFEHAFSYARKHAADTHGLDPLPIVTSNLEWHQQFTMLDFLQHVGIHARVNTMLNRESVRARLESHQGLSFTEFTYQLLQAYDFYYLYKHFGCTVQVGGSDQWGNILAGLELIGRLDGSTTTTDNQPLAFGLTTTLLTTSSGEKFGKSAGNAIWLDSKLTSVLDFYQFFFNTEDADVEKLLKLFTLLPIPVIQDVVAAHHEHPERRIGQRRLADEITELAHGTGGLSHARTLTSLIFESDYLGLTASRIIEAFQSDPRLVLLEEQELLNSSVMKLAAKYGLTSSGSTSRALVQARGLYVNNKAVPDTQYILTKSDLLDNRIAILRAGKNKLIVLVTSTA